jgi:hypothetical protein
MITNNQALNIMNSSIHTHAERTALAQRRHFLLDTRIVEDMQNAHGTDKKHDSNPLFARDRL